MPITVHLLGPPFLIRDGVVFAAPRGRKVWALLAYLALSAGQPSRQQLIDLLFPDAEDPAGTLRWNLSELRRLLGGPDTVGSANVVQLRLPAGTVIDVQVLMGGTSGEAVELPGLGRELLEGMDVDASPGFAAWLLGERRHLQGLSEAVLREGALRALASGNERTAVELATRLVAADPLNEDAHVLLVRAFAASGDEVAVRTPALRIARPVPPGAGRRAGPGARGGRSDRDEPPARRGRRWPCRAAGAPRIGRGSGGRGSDRGRDRELAQRGSGRTRIRRHRDRDRGAALAGDGARARHEREGRGRARPRSTEASPPPSPRDSGRWRPPRIASSGTSSSFAEIIRGRGPGSEPPRSWRTTIRTRWPGSGRSPAHAWETSASTSKPRTPTTSRSRCRCPSGTRSSTRGRSRSWAARCSCGTSSTEPRRRSNRHAG